MAQGVYQGDLGNHNIFSLAFSNIEFYISPGDHRIQGLIFMVVCDSHRQCMRDCLFFIDRISGSDHASNPV